MSDNERSVFSVIRGKKYELLFTVLAAKKIFEEYESLENVSEKLFNSKNFEEQANTTYSLFKILSVDDSVSTDDFDKLLTVAELKQIEIDIVLAIQKGSKTDVESEPDEKNTVAGE